MNDHNVFQILNILTGGGVIAAVIKLIDLRYRFLIRRDEVKYRYLACHLAAKFGYEIEEGSLRFFKSRFNKNEFSVNETLLPERRNSDEKS